ncbi:MAG: hypothetical protein QOH46_211, partial [Solirubrobacteraceae bacterium]|nr:hypothetical protein [Solirubrobacteraceae bacterium]
IFEIFALITVDIRPLMPGMNPPWARR